MPMNFPNNPVNGQIYSPYAGGPTYVWDNSDKVWRFYTGAPPPAVSSDAPSDNKVYVRENAAWIPIPKITVAPSSPALPDVNDMWINSTGLTMMTMMATTPPPPPPVVSTLAVYITDAPSDNVVYARENTTWVPMPKISTGTTAPVAPDVNDLWVDTT